MTDTVEKLLRVANDPSATPAEKLAYAAKAKELSPPEAPYYHIEVRRYKSHAEYNSSRSYDISTASGFTFAQCLASFKERGHKHG